MNIKDMLPFLIPLVIVELILVIITLRHIFTHQHYKRGTRAFWVVMTIGGDTVLGTDSLFSAGKGRCLDGYADIIPCIQALWRKSGDR